MVARQTGRANIIAYPGYCHVHKTIRPEQVVDMLEEHPDAELLLHPECGCVSSCMAKALDGTLPQTALSSFRPKECCGTSASLPPMNSRWEPSSGFSTDLAKSFPEKNFYPVNPQAVCAFMKTITLDKVIRSLETLAPRICVPEHIASKARRAIDRMLELA